MAIDFFIFLLVALAHIGVFILSKRAKRVKQLVVALLIGFSAYPLIVLGIMIGLSGNTDFKWLAELLINAPYVILPISFLPYIMGDKVRSDA